ncbi:hypothetical protein BCR37DRAFT_23832 [Protomyces lactucae-debilis]|uniref:SH3 domain-containing protein n=1 Tax=Protomyces lactucae-debilis TaxID=2754530 RepID=A0A1Y2FDC0_PROLT|nr:uncharacterized protein BCR37DRAFT_23832 [Protomyces lactucae-debilis]ORY81918.1 hypothetical protein BCR37DRAFT_23832 [Protomyces lactucae-debilis]
MSISIGTDVQHAYEQIKAGDLLWAVFGYEGQQSLKVQATSSTDYDEFPDEFSDGRLQYAFLKVTEPNSQLPKFVLVGWCGDGAPRKGIFQQHFASVAGQLTGYHVQVTARSSDDVAMAEIEKKVADASGAKYTVSQASSVFGPTSSKKTNSLVNQLKQQNSSAPLVSARKPMAQTAPRLPPGAPASAKPTVRTASTRKVADWDSEQKAEPVKLPGIGAATTTDTADAPVKSSYQPIGRPDIAALRAQGSGDQEAPSRGSTGTTYRPAEVPKTGALADRMSAFTNNETSSTAPPTTTRPRQSSNPLASRFGQPSFGTKPALPGQQTTGSKALGGLSKNFGAEDGKTPAQLWQERKARERGESIPEPVQREAPVKAAQYGQEEEEERGVGALKEKFAAVAVAPTPPPAAVARSVPPVRAASPEQEEAEEEEVAVPPPPPMNTRPSGAREAEPEPEPETEEEVEEEAEAEASAPTQSTFKDQLAAKIGGGPVAPAAAASSAPAKQASGKPQARVLYDYEAAEEGEVSLAEGALVTEIDQIDEGWWSGTNDVGEQGLFPANYVELVEGDVEAQAAPASKTGAGSEKGQCAVAEYGYEVGEEGEIGFEEGEEITHIEQVDEGWWEGRNAAGEKGLFPSSYVRLK